MNQASFYYWDGDDLILRVHAQPRASRTEISGLYGDAAVKIRINSPPVDGKANAELIKFLAKVFSVSLASVELMSGEGSREKRFRIRKPLVSPDQILNSK